MLLIAGRKPAPDYAVGTTYGTLNILKVLVEEQGGMIGVNSLEGIGSTFYFEWGKKFNLIVNRESPQILTPFLVSYQK